MRSWRVKVAMGLGAVVLAGCSTPLPASMLPLASLAPPHGANGSPAVPQPLAQPLALAGNDPGVPVLDQTLAPLVAGVPWKQRGRASWYGKKFNGQRTASGERFSASGFTAAHRTLPILSYVRVRRVASGEEVIVRINDRGPFHSGRVMDLSHAAAEKLGILALGSAEVEIERLTEDDWRPESPP